MIYGLTKNNQIVKLTICKCDMCVERGMYEVFLNTLDDKYIDCVRILKIRNYNSLNDILILVSKDLEKIKNRSYKLWRKING